MSSATYVPIATIDQFQACENKGLQFQLLQGDWTDSCFGHYAWVDLKDVIKRGAVRAVLEPTLEKVDLNFLVGSGILCEFWDSTESTIGMLDSIKTSDHLFYFIKDRHGDCLAQNNCEPLLNYWHSTHSFNDHDVLDHLFKYWHYETLGACVKLTHLKAGYTL